MSETRRRDGGTFPGSAGSGQYVARVPGLDVYSMRARWAPAVLASLPLLALGALASPLLDDLQKIWALASVGVTTFAALVARRGGHRIEAQLYESWNGKPTTARLRYASATSPQEIARRHAQLERILGDVQLPDRADELADPAAADLEYEAAMSRIVAMLRNNPSFRLVNVENRNYGFARNLLGLKPLGRWSAVATLVVSGGAGAFTAIVEQRPAVAAEFVVPFALSIVALVLWRLIDAAYVQPSAEAYADRVVDALDRLPSADT